MHMELAEFASIVGRRATAPRGHSWEDVESALGLKLPDDYVAWASEYTSLLIGDYLEVFNYSVADLERLPHRLASTVSGVRRVAYSSKRRPLLDMNGNLIAQGVGGDDVRFYPDRNGLLMWGFSGDNVPFMWQTSEDVNCWSIVVSDGVRWWRYDGSFLQFLNGILLGEIDCPFLSDRFYENSGIAEYQRTEAVGTSGGYLDIYEPLRNP